MIHLEPQVIQLKLKCTVTSTSIQPPDNLPTRLGDAGNRFVQT
eukprot:COSAG01_NODE_8203_length_2876_cov_1.280879_2_plen_43_part_00